MSEISGNPPPPLRLWPGVSAALLLVGLRFAVPLWIPGFEGFRIAFIGGICGVIAILVWWLFFSRVDRLERWGAVALMIVILAVTRQLNHESMGLMWGIGYAVPILHLCLVLWAVAGRRWSVRSRRISLITLLLIVSLPWTLVRMDGLTGDHRFEPVPRWTDSHEQQLLARLGERASDGGSTGPPVIEPTSRAADADTDITWPGFRGPHRDGNVPDLRIETDWSRSPPIELWRRAVGPGWSSFAVHGDLLFTQEQRGEHELVSSYDTMTGAPRWHHRSSTRFFEPMSGAGPRATPTYYQGRVYALGAGGTLTCLEAHDGTVVWTRNVADDADTRIPIWGFSGSPLVVDELVVVAAGGTLVAYDRADGEPRWIGPDGGPSYSSPHLLVIDRVEQIVLLSDLGATGVTPAGGTVLWQHEWPGAGLLQPAVIDDHSLLVSAGEGKGIRRIAVAQRDDIWVAEQHWQTSRLKPNFNDLVVHRGHAFGFDGSRLACIELETGDRRWRGGHYGHGQLLLLSRQDLLLVLSETGRLVLVAASSEHHHELAEMPAIEGKTWNHLALAGDLLWVRNGRQMAAFRLPRIEG